MFPGLKMREQQSTKIHTDGLESVSTMAKHRRRGERNSSRKDDKDRLQLLLPQLLSSTARELCHIGHGVLLRSTTASGTFLI